jgi:hypothetical protein
LKKVVDEKRRLYKRLNKASLQIEETGYMNLINATDKGKPLESMKTSKFHSVDSADPQDTNKSRSGYELQFHNLENRTDKVMAALSSTPFAHHVDLEQNLKCELKTLDDQIGKNNVV